MMGTLAVAVWICLVSLGSCYVGLLLRPYWEARNAARESVVETEPLKMRKLSVPFIAEGEVKGYLIVQMSAVARSAQLKKLSGRPEPVLVDEALRLMFSDGAIDLRKSSAKDLGAIAGRISAEANKRLGAQVIDAVLFQEVNYVPRSEIRTGPRG